MGVEEGYEGVGRDSEEEKNAETSSFTMRCQQRTPKLGVGGVGGVI